jgi:hypothetical protein
MSYSVAMHNTTGHYVTALALLLVGGWAIAKVYREPRLRFAKLLWALGLSVAMSTSMLWERPDGPCGIVRGVPLIVERVQSACIDVIWSTGLSVPSAAIDSLVAIGLAHVVVLGVLRLARAFGRW